MRVSPLRIFALAIAVAVGLTACAASTKSSISGLGPTHVTPLQENHGDRRQQATQHSPEL